VGPAIWAEAEAIVDAPAPRAEPGICGVVHGPRYRRSHRRRLRRRVWQDSGRLVQLACERFLTDLEAAANGTSPWAFRPDLTVKPILLTSALPNIKGPEAGKPIRLLAWQKFAMANLFGFGARGTTTRRFRQAVIVAGRGNGKTTWVAPIALYGTFAEAAGGAEGHAAAVARDQARILFDAARPCCVDKLSR
jgi:phage terminase large subunit-like protein